MVSFHFLAFVLFCVAFEVLCIDDKETDAYSSFSREKNEFGFYKPELRKDEARDRDTVTQPFVQAVYDRRTVSLEPASIDDLTEDYSSTPIIQYVPVLKIITPPFQPVYNFRLLKFDDPRSNNKQKYYLLHAQEWNPASRASRQDIPAYYSPQYGSVKIPIHPTPEQPKFLFTTSLSGCSIAIDRLENELEVYHVNGDSEDEEYNNKKNHGYGLVYAVEFPDYGYHPSSVPGKYIKNFHGIVFMKYFNGAWHVYRQNLYSNQDVQMTIHKLLNHDKVGDYYKKADITLAGNFKVVDSAEKELNCKLGYQLNRQQISGAEERWKVSLQPLETFAYVADDFLNTPVIQYIDPTIVRLPFQAIYNFRLSKLDDPRPDRKDKSYYIVHVHEKTTEAIDIPAYFVPPRVSVNIPTNPTDKDPKFLFTTSLSGNTFTIDYHKTYLTVYNVLTDQEDQQYNRLKNHGDGQALALSFPEHSTIENVHGIVFMMYSGTEWQVYRQCTKGKLPIIHQLIGERNNPHKNVDISLTEDLNILGAERQEVFPKNIVGKLPDTVRETFQKHQLKLPYPWEDPILNTNVESIVRQRVRENVLRKYHEQRKMLGVVENEETWNCKLSRRKRETSFCQNLKLFSSDWHDPKKIKIDSEKFIEYIKHNRDDGMNKQLLQFVDNEKIISNIKGDYVMDVKELLRYDDPKYLNLKIDKRINALIGDTYNENKVRELNIRKNVMKYSNRLMLLHSLNSIKHTCVDKANAVSCGLGVGALTWSYASLPIENYLLKKTTPIVTKNIITASQFLKNVLPTTKAISHLFAKTFSKTILKGSLGAVTAGFDVYDIIVNVNILKDCNKLKNTDNECSDKTIRDSIASLVFDEISIVAGVALIAFPVVGLAMTVMTFAAQIVYNGISAVKEYERYNTDFLEEMSIFFNSIIMRKADIAQKLDERQILLDTHAQHVRDLLNAQAEDSSIIAYGVGLGRDGSEPSYSDIYLNYKSDQYKKVSRVQPNNKTLHNMEMICLPSDTGEWFEKGKSQIVSSATYQCHNALVLRHTQRKGDTVILNLELVKEGHIKGSNEWNNIFIIHNASQSLSITGGQNVRNTFTIMASSTKAQISSGRNSLNIFDFRNAEYPLNATARYTMGCSQDRFKMTSRYNILEVHDSGPDENDSRSYQYIGKSNSADDLMCDRDNCGKLVVHSGGGEESRYDEITNCQFVILSPFTTFRQSNNVYDTDDTIYTIYVQTNNYVGRNLKSRINSGSGTINVIFNDFNLIDDTEMIYRPQEKELIVKLYFNNNIFSVTLFPFNIYNGSSNFFLFNKYNHYFMPKISNSNQSNAVLVDTIVRHVKCPKKTIDNIRSDVCTDQVIDYGKNGRNVTIKMFTILNIESIPGNLIIGSSANDVLVINNEIRYASGNEGTDTYYIDADGNNTRFMIHNHALDNMLDVLVMPTVPKTYLISGGEHMRLASNQMSITILNYFNSLNYQHIYFTDSSQMRSFIPLKTSNRILPFIHATPSQRVFVIDELEDYRELVIYAKRSELKLSNYKGNLLIVRENNDPLVIEIKNYFLTLIGYEGTNWFLFENGEFEIFNINDQPVSDYRDEINADYVKYFEEFEVQFDKDVLIKRTRSITEKERIGLLIIDNVQPSTLKVVPNTKNLILFDTVSKRTIQIQNWDEHTSNRISNIEFIKPLKTITITGIHRFNLQQTEEIQNLIDRAAQNIVVQNKFTSLSEVGVKCLVTIYGFTYREYPTYACIGTDSVDEQTHFFEQECNANQLEKMKKRANIPLELNAVALKLKNQLHLDAFNSNMTSFCDVTIDGAIKSFCGEYMEYNRDDKIPGCVDYPKVDWFQVPVPFCNEVPIG